MVNRDSVSGDEVIRQSMPHLTPVWPPIALSYRIRRCGEHDMLWKSVCLVAELPRRHFLSSPLAGFRSKRSNWGVVSAVDNVE